MKGVSIALKTFVIVFVFFLGGMLLISFFSVFTAEKELNNAAQYKLKHETERRKQKIEDLFEDHYFTVNTISKMPDVFKLFNSLNNYFNKNFYISDESIDSILNLYGTTVDRFIRKMGYSDVFLVNKSGKIVYSFNKEENIGFDLNDDYKRLRNVQKTWKKLKTENKVFSTDFLSHPIYENTFQAYLASPLISESGENIAGLILEVPYYEFGRIVKNEKNLGNTGECIVFGADSMVRNNLKYNDTSAFAFKIKTPDAKAALAGQYGFQEAVDYRDVLVMSCTDVVQIGELKWFILVKRDKSELYSSQISLKNKIVILSIVLIVIAGILLVLIFKTLFKPIEKIKHTLLDMQEGIIPQKIENYRWNDETGQLVGAVNNSINRLKENTLFAKAIGQNNLAKSINIDICKDELANSLLELRNRLKKTLKEEEKRKLEDQQRNWASNGITELSGILRQNNDNIELLAYELLEWQINYLEANQGGIFLLSQDDQPVLELVSSYAYDRRKYLQKTIQAGEGYIGTCMLEKEKIFLTEVPDEYLEITSGLGNSSPKCILIIPLKFKEEIVGVMELASFNVFEPYQVAFIENVAESIANTLISVRNNIKNEKLLRESKRQEELLRQQEEEMRQNLEEMKATQEELSREQNENVQVYEALDKAAFIVEYTKEGKIQSANDAYLKFLNFEFHHLKGKVLKDNIEFLDKYNHDGGYERFWKDLHGGKTIQILSKLSIFYQMFQSTYFLKESYIPVKDDNDEVIKIIKIAINVTDFVDLYKKEDIGKPG